MADTLLSTKEVAGLLSISERKVRDMAISGELPAIKTRTPQNLRR